MDEEDQIISVLAGQPQAEDWDNVHHQMSDLLQDTPRHLEGIHQEWRGNFISISTGVSYRGGQTASI